MDKEVDGILVAAHELKAPLAVLRQLALSFDEMDSSNERIRTEMISVSERALKQVNDLTRIKRLEDGLFEMEPVSIRSVCDEVTRELEYLFRFNRRELFVKYSNRTQLVTANRELLKSVIYNFLLNAMHYSGEGTRAELVVKDYRDKVKVSIRDYGPALPIEVWKEMRRGWVEKPTTIAMRPGSSGLGLFIASRFSRYMRAEVGATRHRDGTSFYVELPSSKQMRLF
ncbi:MAG: HAMP domain-containing sensor histidine kinase [Candidatus Saccharibacteria bacterium]|nr:HAMP domain-containing sensor histidine kinase [Candidatus Saccharibacteria bacterium]